MSPPRTDPQSPIDDPEPVTPEPDEMALQWQCWRLLALDAIEQIRHLEHEGRATAELREEKRALERVFIQLGIGKN
jgi:hypothetical protein